MTDLQQQLSILRKYTEPRFGKRIKIGCLTTIALVVVGILIAGYSLGKLEFIFPALIFAALGVALFQSFSQGQPHSLRARQALDHYESVSSTVRITHEIDDSTHIYMASALDRVGNYWTFRCYLVSGNLETGDYTAELRYIEQVPWPVLVITETCVLYPLSDPEQKQLEFPEKPPSPSGALIIFGVFMIAVSIIWSTVIWNMYRRDANIVESGVAVHAEIIKVGHLRVKKNENCCLIYRFTLPNGKVIEKTWHEEEGRWRAYQTGDRILIRYHPDNPERHLIEYPVETALSNTLRFIAIGGIIFLGIGTAFVVSGIRYLKKKR